MFEGCPRCRAEGVAVNLTVEHDLSPLHSVTPELLFPPAPRNLWRFKSLLPVRPAAPASLGEGATPLVHLERLGRRLGLRRLFAKDESQNPTWSYKDRLCALAVAHAVAIGARVITISSTGNHGAATAAYAARAGLPCVAFTLASVPEAMKTLMQAYGAAVVTCPTSEARWRLMRQGVERLGWYPTSGYAMPPVGSTPWGVEGYKTIAYEIAEDLGWTAPDVVAIPAAYSDGLAGVFKGFAELAELGLVKHAPRMVAAEPFGPLARALERGLDAPEAVPPASASSGLPPASASSGLDGPAPSVAFSIGSRYGTWQGLDALRRSGGLATALTDEGILEAQRLLARDEGLYVEPSAAAALTAVMQLAARKALDPEATIAVVLTSGGLKDPGATRTWLPEVPAAGDDFDAVLTTLHEHYGLVLDR
jgi:threonine synthase